MKQNLYYFVYLVLFVVIAQLFILLRGIGCKMMFNGLMMCGDSDTSDFTKDSIPSSVASAEQLETKLMATMSILQNKEETIRVQAESLALAEARIAALNAKAHQPKQHQAQQTNPFNAKRSSAVGNHVEMSDVSASVQEAKIVKTLQDNLSVIEDLYRECFYETAKQEELITMLRRSYLDMKLVDRQKTEQIDFLQNTLQSHNGSVDRYKDIAMEVENLKVEISNFLNSSANNDSGVWECEPAAELRDIADQLMRLQDLLRTDCICGLEEENNKLKQRNEIMEVQVNGLQRKISELEAQLEDKENMDQKYQNQIADKECELRHIRQQLATLERGTSDRGSSCDTLTVQLKQLQDMLNDKTAELLQTQQQCDAQEVTIRDLQEEILKADAIADENRRVQGEVSSLAARVAGWRAELGAARPRLRALDDQLRRAHRHARLLAERYRQKAEEARALQGALSEAHERGSALCADASRATRQLRRWLAEQRARRREQDEKIKEQEAIIQSLRLKERTGSSENEPCCSRYLPRVEARRSERDCLRASEMTGCSKCAYSRLQLRTSESEPAASPSPPTPPRRLLRKKPLCVERPCQCPLRHEAGVQAPPRRDAFVDARLSRESLHSCRETPSREESPPEELLERVERAREALAAAQRRWGRRAPP